MKVTSTAQERQPWRSTLLAGFPGSGLASAASDWPAPLYAACGADLRAIAHLDLPMSRVETIEDLMRLLGKLSEGEGAQVEAFGDAVGTLVIDSLNGLEQRLGFDAGKARGLVAALGELPVKVVLISHLRYVGGCLVPTSVLGSELGEMVDLALRVDSGEHPYVQAWPDDRLPWVVDRSGRLPRQMSLIPGTDLYRLLAGLIGEDLGAARPTVMNVRVSPPAPPAAPTPPAPAAPPAAAAAAPPAASEPDPEPEPVTEPDPDPDVVECTSKGRLGNECLGVADEDSQDVAKLRRMQPMCAPCLAAEYDALPKTVPRKRAAAPAAAAPKPVPAPAQVAGRPEDVAVIPHGEVVGRIQPTDSALRAFLDS